jgi:hypothetical protein
LKTKVNFSTYEKSLWPIASNDVVVVNFEVVGLAPGNVGIYVGIWLENNASSGN